MDGPFVLTNLTKYMRRSIAPYLFRMISCSECGALHAIAYAMSLLKMGQSIFEKLSNSFSRRTEVVLKADRTLNETGHHGRIDSF